MATSTSASPDNPAVTRLARFSSLSTSDIESLHEAAREPQRLAAHVDILREEVPIAGGSIMLAGWACRLRLLADGRRQILSLLLPGDLIGVCRQKRAVATTSVVTLTSSIICSAPAPGEGGLAEAYAVSGALEELYLFRQITRLGRLSAEERIVDSLFEIQERLAAAGLAGTGSFPMPLTQELLADTLGLTAVHVNRTLQQLRRDGMIELGGGRASLLDPERLRLFVDHRPARVSLG